MYQLYILWSDGVKDATKEDTIGGCLRYLQREEERIGTEMDYPKDIRIIKATIEEEN